MNFVSTPWKIKISLGKRVGDHIWAIYIYMGRWVGGGNVDDSRGGWVGGGVGVGGGWVIIIFQGVLTKLNLSTKFRHLKKIIFFCIFLLWGRVKLNFRDRYGKPNIYSKNSSCYKVFSSNSQKLSLCCKKKSLSTQMDLYDPYKIPTLFPRGILIFQGVLTKFNF